MTLRTRDLPFLARLGLTALLGVILLGMAASASHLFDHYKNRDEQKRFTLDDVRAAYHGLNKPSPLVTSLDGGHPETLKADSRGVLVRWLKSGRIAEDYDNIDLGVDSPSGIIAASCLSCHGSKSADPKAAAIRLDTLDAIKKLAFTKIVNRNPDNIIIMSAHAHALSLGTLAVALCGLLWATRLPRGLASFLIAVNGLALFADLVAWWLARTMESFVYVIAGAGTAYNGTTVLIAVLVVLDLWWPRRVTSV
ncbi:MAG: hypothetical protein IT438_01930 [Phycisphaerales bacterium]|nr:hypothetical protein [Phycisphaerales bacterium]